MVMLGIRRSNFVKLTDLMYVLAIQASGLLSGMGFLELTNSHFHNSAVLPPTSLRAPSLIIQPGRFLLNCGTGSSLILKMPISSQYLDKPPTRKALAQALLFCKGICEHCNLTLPPCQNFLHGKGIASKTLNGGSTSTEAHRGCELGINILDQG